MVKELKRVNFVYINTSLLIITSIASSWIDSFT